MSDPTTQARADEIFAAGQPRRDADAADLDSRHTAPHPGYFRDGLNKLDRTFAMQRARAEARNALDQQPVAWQDACRAHGVFYPGVAA